MDNHSVKCWGYNSKGQLGLGDKNSRGDRAEETGDNLPEIGLGTNRTALMIQLGGTHTCALLDNNAVKCWGNNAYGQLGLGVVAGDDRGDETNEMGDLLPSIDLGIGKTVLSLQAGVYHNCVLFTDNTVKCWGQNTYSQLGLPSSYNRGTSPEHMGDNLPIVDLGRTVLSIDSRNFHTCAILDNNSLKCWGVNWSGQLGLGDTEPRGVLGSSEMGDNLPSIDLGSGRTATSLQVGGHHTCAILDNNSVKCWGDNYYGQLGLGNTDYLGNEEGEMGDQLPVLFTLSSL